MSGDLICASQRDSKQILKFRTEYSLSLKVKESGSIRKFTY
ncbi:uncharacterized protein METZ01_LOCUS137344 [marine metagenome]|uniref:Uncharacterized protein n=1 Tax=marine metagenome TaxID=408172 RepID=A0A381Z5J2_9ZZZZ